MASKHPITTVTQDLMGEVAENAKSAATALAWPDHVAGTQKISQAEEARLVRELALSDPTYLPRKLDEMAPKVIKGPDGQMYRPIQGMQRFQALVKNAMPELWAAYALQEVE